jgi:hypothetical protein
MDRLTFSQTLGLIGVFPYQAMDLGMFPLLEPE